MHASLKDNIELRPHQVEGVNNMIMMERTYRGGILADEVGVSFFILSFLFTNYSLLYRWV